MKKVNLLVSALAITLSLAACGSTPITMVAVTSDAGIQAELPSDFTTTDNKVYQDKDTGENAIFTTESVSVNSIDNYTQENMLDTFKENHPDITITSYDNSKQVDGMQSVQATGTYTKDGSPILFTMIIFTDKTTNFIVNYTYIKDGTLEKNLQASIDSIKIQ